MTSTTPRSPRRWSRRASRRRSSTCRIITEENAKYVPDAALEAWQHAIDEYQALMEDQETEPQ